MGMVDWLGGFGFVGRILTRQSLMLSKEGWATPLGANINGWRTVANDPGRNHANFSALLAIRPIGARSVKPR